MIWLFIALFAIWVMYLSTKTDPEERPRPNHHLIAKRVGRELGKSIASGVTWAPGTRKHQVRRRRK